MRQNAIQRAFGLLLLFVVGRCCLAQTVNIWPGVAPGSENWKQMEHSVEAPYGTVIIDVVTPTLTPYLPERSKATGTGVVVAPGGSVRCTGDPA